MCTLTLCKNFIHKIRLFLLLILNNPAPFHFDIAGYRSKLHSSATITQRQESIKKETDKKLDEDRNSDEMSNILQLASMQQVQENFVSCRHILSSSTFLS